MQVPIIRVSKKGSKPTVSVFIGQAQYGQYEVTLKSPDGTRTVQGEGDNADDVSDTFPLKPPVASLDQAVLSWWVTVAAPTAAAGQLYFVRVSIEQDGKVLSDGAFEYS